MEKVRLQKRIAECSDYSRREAEKLIEDGRVKVNGEIVNTLGYKVSNKDNIEIDYEVLSKNEYKYYLLNKPEGYICSTKDEKGRKTVMDLIPNNHKIYPIGRLDYDTSGLLLLTNDGDFANLMMHPKYRINKTYLAKLDKIFTKFDQMIMKKGIHLGTYTSKPTSVKLRKINYKSGTSLVEITIHEGHYHQVKEMFKALNYNVIGLKRIKYGNLTLEGIKKGDYVSLSKKEVSRLYVLANMGERNGNI